MLVSPCRGGVGVESRQRLGLSLPGVRLVTWTVCSLFWLQNNAVKSANPARGAKWRWPSKPTATVLLCCMEEVRDPGAMLALTTAPPPSA